uniref:Inositol 1,4,5-trisphosphate/ryanodine receptor domain-containing protein n=1 Tax=Anolis carolinensis TaxID=28377 RepID=A0A803TRM7_ANOCA
MAEGGDGGEDEIQFLRTDDEVVLQCVANIHKEQRKFCLAAEGLGNRLCFLEPTSEAKYVPPDLCICNFVLEQSLSVRALQEMLANTGDNSSEGVSKLILLCCRRLSWPESQGCCVFFGLYDHVPEVFSPDVLPTSMAGILRDCDNL